MYERFKWESTSVSMSETKENIQAAAVEFLQEQFKPDFIIYTSLKEQERIALFFLSACQLIKFSHSACTHLVIYSFNSSRVLCSQHKDWLCGFISFAIRDQSLVSLIGLWWVRGKDFLPFHFLHSWRTSFFHLSGIVRCSYKITGSCGGSQKTGHASPWPPGVRWERAAGCQSGLGAERRRGEWRKEKKWVLMGKDAGWHLSRSQ